MNATMRAVPSLEVSSRRKVWVPTPQTARGVWLPAMRAIFCCISSSKRRLISRYFSNAGSVSRSCCGGAHRPVNENKAATAGSTELGPKGLAIFWEETQSNPRRAIRLRSDAGEK